MAGINFIRRWVMSQMKTKADDGIMIKLPDKNKVDLNVSITMDRLIRNGIDPDQLTNTQQVENALNMIDSRMASRAIPADSAEGREITEKIFGKQKAPVFDMEGNRIPEGSGIMGGKSIKELMDSGQVSKGARGINKSKKVTDREMFQAANERLTSDVDTIVKNIKRLSPMDAMKEANLVIGRKGYYKNLSPEESKKILQDTEDHIFERDIPETEDFAAGGIARAGFVGGGMGRRGFLKLLAGAGAGIGALKSGLVNILGKGTGKEVAKEVVKQSASTPPPYFFKLAEKIKTLGDDVTQQAATQERQIVKRYKDYELKEDMVTGDMQIKKTTEGSYYDQDGIMSEEYMSYSKGQSDEINKTRTADEYEEITISPDNEGKLKEVEDGLDSMDEIIKEVGEQAPSIKKASGGIARMLGE